MKAIKVAVSLILALVLMLSTGGLAQDLWMIPAGLSFSLFGEKVASQTNGLAADPSTIWVAVTEDVERWPDVAHGGDQILVVFTKTKNQIGNIYASVISESHPNPLLYPITNNNADCGHPAISYHSSSGLFIVVYEKDHHEIIMQAISVMSGNLEIVGKPAVISGDDAEKGYPAIACSQTNDSCLVAFQYERSQVKGTYVDVDNSGINYVSPVYDLSDAIAAGRPYLAWGNGVGTYLVAYTEQKSTGEILPGYTHVIEHDDPLVDIKYLHPSTPAVPPGFSPSGYDALVSDVAFDPCTQKFLISIDYDAAGDGSNFDVWTAILHSTDSINFTPMAVADSPGSEHSSAISFVTTDSQSPSCGAMDRLLVGYINDEVGLMAVELRGNSSSSTPVYTCDAAHQHHVVECHTSSDRVNAVRILGGAGERRFLMVYQINQPFSSDEDIWGKFVRLLDLVYLPLVMR